MSSGALSGSLTKCTCIYNERPVIHENLYTFFATFYTAAGPLIWQAHSINKGHFVQHGAKPLSATTESIAGPYVHVSVANRTHISSCFSSLNRLGDADFIRALCLSRLYPDGCSGFPRYGTFQKKENSGHILLMYYWLN